MPAQTYIPAHVNGGTPAPAPVIATVPVAATTTVPIAPIAPAAPVIATVPVATTTTVPIAPIAPPVAPAPETPAAPAPALALVPGTPIEAPAPTPEAPPATPAPVTVMVGLPAPAPPTKVTTTITGEPVAPTPAPEAPKAPEVDWRGIAMKQGAEIALTTQGIDAKVAALIMPKLLADNDITFDENGNVTLDTVAVNAAVATLRTAYGSSVSPEIKAAMNPLNKPAETGPKNWRENIRSVFR